jgi:DinB superfamily
MDHSFVVQQLSLNQNTFKDLLSGISKDFYMWKPKPDKWCLLEIVCHLYDEEQFDFKARTQHILENVQTDPSAIDPAGWVKTKKYLEQNYEDMLKKFLEERKKSVDWLNSLKEPDWKNQYIHPKFGPMSAEFFLSNWLAHDYLHFRQITALKYNYLKEVSGTNLMYAGDW